MIIKLNFYLNAVVEKKSELPVINPLVLVSGCGSQIEKMNEFFSQRTSTQSQNRKFE